MTGTSKHLFSEMSPEDLRETRRQILQQIDERPNAIEEVLAYCENHFVFDVLPSPPILPLPDEGHLEDWRGYIYDQGDAPFSFLQERIVQLNIPVRQGISKTKAYADSVRRGKSFDREVFGDSLSLERPDLFSFDIHEHPAGALPVINTPHRPDFETLVQALAYHSEPQEINPSVNAQMVTGFVNWDRVRRYESSWRGKQDSLEKEGLWYMEMGRVAKFEPWRFQDRFIIVTVHPYSSMPAPALDLGLLEKNWLEKSTMVRLEHEFTHYATKRLYGKMSLNVLDEIICDWAGLTATVGGFKAALFLLFLGLENLSDVRESGRIHVYRQDLTDDGFHLLCNLTVKAAEGLEALHRIHYEEAERQHFFLALTQLTLELMACEDRELFFSQAYRQAARLMDTTIEPVVTKSKLKV